MLHSLIKRFLTETTQTLFFIHIPKTAGSSFREAAAAYFGSKAAFYDYGNDSKKTHHKIKELDYDRKDRFASGQYICKHARFLSGHVPYLKYAPFFNPKNIITFLRAPDQQIRSHYEHYVRHLSYKGTFESFIKDKRFCNQQSRQLNGITAEAIGFIGLTEHYDESIYLINRLYSLNINPIKINQNNNKSTENYQFTANEIALMKQYNNDDFLLYEYAQKRFKRQQNAILSNQAFLRFHQLHLPPKLSDKMVNGWLTAYENDNIQKAEVRINGHYFTNISGSEYRAQPQKQHMNRAGFIGFILKYPEDIKSGDLIEFIAINNGECIHSFTYP